VDEQAVRAAVTELAGFLRADGGDLVVVEANPKTDRIRLQLVLDDVSCAECILAPSELFATIEQSLQRSVAGEFELVVDDPRNA
jgi:Fe-S cluster biogenesis protein NfuA